MKDILAVFGFVCLVGLVGGLLLIFIERIKGVAINLKRRYVQKHRFDKPPTATCYCVDCRFHSTESLICYRLQKLRTADNWFCCHAEPRK